MRIFLTGGTGFLGKPLARALADAGHTVTCLVRRSSDRTGLDHPRIAFAPGDVTEKATVEAALSAGYDAVLHTAALVKSWVPRRDMFDEVNVGGFRNVVGAALDAGVPRILYTSSFFALGPTDGFVGDETTHHDPRRFCHDYERTKYLADCEALRLMERGAPLIALYPGVIYGPGERTEGNIIAGLLLDFLTDQPWLARKMPGVLGTGRRLWSYAYVDDVVQGHLAALDCGEVGQRYVLAGENVSLLGLQERFGEITGLKPFTRKLPYLMGSLAGLGEEVRARFGTHQPFNTRATVRIFKHDWAYSSEKAGVQLGYRYRPLLAGLRETMAWVCREALVARPRSR